MSFCPTLVLEPRHITSTKVEADKTTLQIRIPFTDDIKLKNDGYYLDGERYDYPDLEELDLKMVKEN